MASRPMAASLGIVVALALAGVANGQQAPSADGAKSPPAAAEAPEADAKKTDTPKPAKTETATFGGGCFWCTEAVFERVPGVKSVVSGYSGGLVPNPTYQQVCTGSTGHAEVVQLEFDPDKVSYEAILKVFWTTHDPTTLNAQGPDFGTQYRSIILYHSDDQKKAAQKVYQEMKAKRTYRSPIVTELVPFIAFYPAEPYHQDYYRNHPYDDYSMAYIVPKIRKLKAHAPTPAKAATPAPK